MLHLIFNDKSWFRSRRFGLGSGLPLCWQGWGLIALHAMLIAGIALFLGKQAPAIMVIAVLAPLPIYAAKTQGGWHWRWGDER